MAKPSRALQTGSESLSSPKVIQVRGACEHNLKNLSVDLPRNQFIVVTGPSGSGKSSLAFDTLFAEGQRRYIESLSAYARQFVEQLKKPEVESIRGLCPSVAIQQKALSKNPRSTVGTLTEIYDFLRLLYSRVGEAKCPHCQTPISTLSTSAIVDQIMAHDEARINIIAVVARRKKGEFVDEINDLVRMGIVRARIDDQDLSLEKGIKLEKQKPHTVEAYIDRLVVKADARSRIEDAVQLASDVANGQVQIEFIDTKKSQTFSERLSCLQCGLAYVELSPRLFSFNSPIGACQRCRGLGYLAAESEEDEVDEMKEHEVCPDCRGTRLNPYANSVFVGGKSITEWCELSIKDSFAFISSLSFEGNQKIIAEKILKEVRERLGFLIEVGLHYLSLSRRASTLSGGEEQRVKLATQIGTHLTGVLYVLDEPSIGLHQVDSRRLIDALQKLKAMGNTVIVVEHDADVMKAADLILDLGPGAGRLGGHLIEMGAPRDLKKGLTADYLLGRKSIPLPHHRRPISEKFLSIRGAHLHNLKNIDVDFPLSAFTVVTGVSGSGKSSLVMDVICESLATEQTIGCREIIGRREIDKLVRVDQSPIGRSPRSNPATYIGVFGLIRDFFAQTPQAKVRGFKPSRFSFNIEGGRCEDCKGAGVLDIEMHFLPNVSVPCETCNSRRYNAETVSILFKGRSIFDVLEMTFDEAKEFFSAIPAIASRLQVIVDVGLGYIKLGQPALTLSGGEAQRVKLAKEICRRSTGKTLYVFDEPTTGLHFVDVQKLIDVIQRLVDLGNTVVVIEHHLDVIKSADNIIDLGPGGGDEGGEKIASGTPEAISKNKNSLTGKFLVDVL